MPKNKDETNSQKLLRFLEYSNSGPLMQGFIMMSILDNAEAVIKHYTDHPEKLGEEAIINPKAWLACAEEIVLTWRKPWNEVKSIFEKAADGMEDIS